MAQDDGLPQRKWNASDVRRLYQWHGAALVVYARSFLPDVAAAEDAVHSVFAKLLRAEIVVPDSEAGYLYRAVKNVALNVRRDAARNGELPGDVAFVHSGGNIVEAIALQHALDQLPEEQREVVIMRIWNGMTLEEIGAATGVPPNTAASRYRYALERLRERLGPRISKKD